MKQQIQSATLLSVEEYEKYRKMIPPVKEDWWLRSQGYYDTSAAFVHGVNGLVLSCGDLVLRRFGVRPALRILNPESLMPGDKFAFGGQTFTYLGEGLAICDDIVKKCAFRKDWGALDANNYEKSDVKAYVENWFEKAKEKETENLKKKGESAMNTEIHYQYRDGSNYKQPQSVVVEGELSQEQIQEIYSRCDEYVEGEVFDPEIEEPIYFIPRQVGLPETRFEKITEDDHCWFEMGMINLTDKAPTIQMTAKEVLENFEEVDRWDDVGYAVIGEEELDER